MCRVRWLGCLPRTVTTRGVTPRAAPAWASLNLAVHRMPPLGSQWSATPTGDSSIRHPCIWRRTRFTKNWRRAHFKWLRSAAFVQVLRTSHPSSRLATAGALFISFKYHDISTPFSISQASCYFNIISITIYTYDEYPKHETRSSDLLRHFTTEASNSCLFGTADVVFTLSKMSKWVFFMYMQCSLSFWGSSLTCNILNDHPNATSGSPNFSDRNILNFFIRIEHSDIRTGGTVLLAQESYFRRTFVSVTISVISEIFCYSATTLPFTKRKNMHTSLVKSQQEASQENINEKRYTNLSISLALGESLLISMGAPAPVTVSLRVGTPTSALLE